LRKFNSTPLLNELKRSISSSTTTSEESGWVSNNDNESELPESSDEELLPPPIQFQDIKPPIPFRDQFNKGTFYFYIHFNQVTKYNIFYLECNCIVPLKSQFTSSIPYFLIPDELRIFHPKGLHLIICAHGLDGTCHDLRLFKIYLEVSLPGHNIHFLMSEKNQVKKKTCRVLKVFLKKLFLKVFINNLKKRILTGRSDV